VRPIGIGLGVGFIAGAAAGVTPVAAWDASTSTLAQLTALASVSRPSLATMFDSTGKLTYGPNNLLTQSNTFSNAAWTANSNQVTVTSGFTDPLGGSNAWRLQGTGNSWYLLQQLSYTGQTLITFWVKSNTGLTQNVKLVTGGNGGADIPVTTSWTQIALAGLNPTTPNGSYVGIRRDAANSLADILIYAPTASAVTYETTPRTGDQVITTSAAYYGPRIDYDPATLAVKGLLIEEARTNASYPSTGSLSGGNWTVTALNYPSATTGIDGTNSAVKAALSAGTSASAGYAISTTASNTGVVSAYARPAGYNYLILVRGAYASNDWAIFDVNGGTVVQAPTFAGSTAIIRQGPNGFWYCELRSTQNTTISAFSVTSAVNNTANANGTDGIYITEFQTELGVTFGTSRIRTSTASVTRASDALTAASLTTNPAIIQYRSISTGTRARKVINPWSGVSSEVDEWIEAIRIYPSGTSGTYLNTKLTVDGPW